ncbi:serine/threonine-protein kinase [Streptomyces sp. HUAS TT20]|uniref:serine/threonine-protein kinase n=1 Tax=Streptomyces sp. HUAS TT20 TaxID=3447509 RepID=UPI0021DB1245|nr:serine/threonine-protein kinase [Streptomyces sp. HUAS 15-9]UXY25606.1 serine/threonine protein kinase [Streptomyces sp. HUAS 15-9]
MNSAEAELAPPMAPGTRPVPGYQVLGHLTRTSWLDVYDSWSEERDCRCVLKTLRPDRRGDTRLHDRLLREGRWLRDFSHPHLVRAYETFSLPEPLVVLETLTGETLAHMIHRLRRRPSAADVALLGVQLCSAVHYLHAQGLLHLDLKPSNVVVERGHAKVFDLSVARPPGPAPAGLGTRCYRAPEQEHVGELSTPADVWGIGITLYEVAAGDVTFVRAGAGESAVERCEVPPIASRRRLPRALAAAIDGCLRADPSARLTLPELAGALGATPPGEGPRTARA